MPYFTSGKSLEESEQPAGRHWGVSGDENRLDDVADAIGITAFGIVVHCQLLLFRILVARGSDADAIAEPLDTDSAIGLWQALYPYLVERPGLLNPDALRFQQLEDPHEGGYQSLFTPALHEAEKAKPRATIQLLEHELDALLDRNRFLDIRWMTASGRWSRMCL